MQLLCLSYSRSKVIALGNQGVICVVIQIYVCFKDIGNAMFEERIPRNKFKFMAGMDVEDLKLNSELLSNFEYGNGGPTTCAQSSVYSVIGRYMDLHVADTSSDYLYVCCLHAMQHMMRTRKQVLKNNAALKELHEKKQVSDDVAEKIRDQGLARPKVLILCPMKKDAHRIVEFMRILMFGNSEKQFVTNFRRFKTEFGDTGFRISEKRKVSDDYRSLMNGNTDDCFRLGTAVARKCFKLYTSFENSDCIIASPLGLRMIVGDPGSAERETDFLASIEILIIYKADILLMQNWEHLHNVIGSLHISPKDLSVDISRIRLWNLEQLSKLYRQTILLSSYRLAECEAIFATGCRNYEGLVEILPASRGLLDNITKQTCQELQRIFVDNAETQSDKRFMFFKTNVLPKCDQGSIIFIPSYFDFVRFRNHLKNENESFVQLHEYAKEGKVAKARALFHRRTKKLMLLTERFHFFRRYNIKGVKSVVFYQPPVRPEFYHELINMATVEDSGRIIIRLLYTKFDSLRLSNIFGDPMTRQLFSSEKQRHVLLSK